MDTNTLQKTYADKLCLATIVSLLLGFFFFSLCFILDYVLHAGRDLRGLLALLSFLLSITLFYLVAPLLGVISIIVVFGNWHVITNLDDIPRKRAKISTIANRFLITSLLFELLFFLNIILRIFSTIIQNIMPTSWQSNWLIIMAIIILVMSYISYRLLTEISNQIAGRAVAIFAVVISIVVVVTAFGMSNFGSYLLQRVKYSIVSETFSSDSSLLKDTIIIPTLDNPCIDGKNVIWCSSFQLAWNRMKDDVGARFP